MSTYTPEEYTMTITLEESSMANRYAKALALSMQRTKDMIVKEMFEHAKYRPVGYNEYIHGAKDAIRKQTETV
jgi:hypothetical protein